MNKISLPAVLETVRDKKDRSVGLSFETRELTNDEFIYLREYRGLEGNLLFSPNTIQEADIPKEDAVVEKKTQSVRLRNCLYKLWEQEKPEITWDVFYYTRMEKLINQIKDRLE